jgi:hypothetical protein
MVNTDGQMSAKSSAGDRLADLLANLGIGVGSRWRDPNGETVVVAGVGRMGVVVYRREDDPAAEEEVTDAVRFLSDFQAAQVA